MQIFALAEAKQLQGWVEVILKQTCVCVLLLTDHSGTLYVTNC